jgi:23S rRNA pseudouridine1911/1915/1917 synthase
VLSSLKNLQKAKYRLHKVETFVISDGEQGNRLDKYCQLQLKNHSRSFIQNCITRGYITVNGAVVKAGYQLRAPDRVAIEIPDPETSKLMPENIPLSIVYEDPAVLVVDKPAGMVVHPGAGNYTGTLVNALLFQCHTLSGINGVLRPGIVHRLDKNTSGLLVIAKNDQAHQFLAGQFATREIERTYIALIWGTPAQEKGEIETLIDRSRRDRKKMGVYASGRQAITHYERLQSFHYLALLKLQLKTGRTHQIRVHLNHIQHPVFGDPDYNGRNSQLHRLPSSLHTRGKQWLASMPRQALHARSLSFIHPNSRERMSFESPLPTDFQQLLERIRGDLHIE